MKLVALALGVTLCAASDGFAQAEPSVVERFDGAGAVDALCSFLFKARRSAEMDGRLDFAATIESTGSDALIARISAGTTYAIGRIHFSGHRNINDMTLRRTLSMMEREMLDVQRLRRGLTRINGLGAFEPLTLADVIVTRLDDGVTVDLEIPLRERKRRWWSIGGVLLPGVNPLQASLASRLPPWGRGFFELATYFVSLNLVGFVKPFFALERSLIPGQEWLSGFAITLPFSPRAMATRYAQTHALHAASGLLDADAGERLSVDLQSAGAQPDSLVCTPPKPRLRWLRAVARVVAGIYG